MLLCDRCNSANGLGFEVGDCSICHGAAMETDKMIAEATDALVKEDIGSFSISTIMPKEWSIREEKVWDQSIAKAESIKNSLNKEIVASLRRSTGLKYDGDGDCRVVLDYAEKKVYLRRNELFLFGRYKKLSAGLSQSRWKCSKCEGRGCPSCGGKGKYYDSVEERIGEPVKAASEAADYVMHASGREDVDATNSAGRAFVLEIKEPRKRKLDLRALEEAIASSGEVSVSGLSAVGREFVEVVTESHFDKTYEAEVQFGREISDADALRIKTLEGKTILQQTPIRVSHRRADLIRNRKIKNIEALDVNGSKARVIVRAEAGTYIKELVSGDGGRTKPSIAGLLGTEAKCTRLEVTMIDDPFLDFCLKNKGVERF